jgi:site-specific DNA-methyltransferase (adenine-specific)
MELHTLPGETVLDPFCGAGSTAKACEILGRNFIGIELDPAFHAQAERCIKAERQKGNLFA